LVDYGMYKYITLGEDAAGEVNEIKNELFITCRNQTAVRRFRTGAEPPPLASRFI
jgi:hypothetical protein